MADSKPSKQSVAGNTGDTKQSAETGEAVKPATSSQTLSYRDKNFWLLLVTIAASILFLSIAYVAGFRAATHDRDHHLPYAKMGSPRDQGYTVPGRLDGGRDNTSTTRLSGVVTAVDGDTITIAGNGTTSKVKVSSNTTYTGSSEPAKVNDTILAYGAKDGDNTLVASSVRLVRE